MPDGKQRYFCNHCRISFSWSTGRIKYQREFEWFERWVIEGYSVRQLAKQSGLSPATIRRIIHYWLTRPPKDQLCPGGRESVFLVCDGTYLHHRHGMFAAFDAHSHRLVYAAYGITEGPTGMVEFCRRLVAFGVSPKAAIIDGNRHLFRALRLAWPDIIIQRCLVHIQRQGLSWCRNNPKRVDARKLREIYQQVLSVSNHEQKEQFLNAVQRWNEHYGTQFTERGPVHGWVATDLNRARSMLLRAIPYMFHYLDNKDIPISTNIAEGYFSRLKKHYRLHQGLAPHQRENYFRWYFHLCQL